MINIICIDLTNFKKEQLNEVGVKYNLNIEILINNKQDDLLNYIDADKKIIVTFTKKKVKCDIILYSISIKDILNPIIPIKLI